MPAEKHSGGVCGVSQQAVPAEARGSPRLKEFQQEENTVDFFKNLVSRSSANSDVLLTGAGLAFLLTWIF